MKVVKHIYLEDGSIVYPAKEIPEDEFVNEVFASIKRGSFIEIKTSEKEMKGEITEHYNSMTMRRETIVREKLVSGEKFFNINPNKIMGYLTEEVEK